MPPLPNPEPATTTALYAAAVRPPRHFHPRLSASSLADCDRLLWDAFRWAYPPERVDGRKSSIFETGEVWEERLIARLKAAGVTVTELDPDTGEQWRVVFAAGHGSGRLDGLATGVPEAPKAEHVVEIKSHNDRSFKGLLKDGVATAKPAHYAQMQVYMHLRGVDRALYVAVNKNDDTVYSERVRYDAAAAIALMAKAERIVTSDRRPPCSCPPYFLKSGYGCAVNDGQMAIRSCRTCLHATAHLDGDARWSCARWRKDLTLDEQQAGCPSHLYVPDLVLGEQVDADEAGEWVEYELTGGTRWRDGAS